MHDRLRGAAPGHQQRRRGGGRWPHGRHPERRREPGWSRMIYVGILRTAHLSLQKKNHAYGLIHRECHVKRLSRESPCTQQEMALQGGSGENKNTCKWIV